MHQFLIVHKYDKCRRLHSHLRDIEYLETASPVAWRLVKCHSLGQYLVKDSGSDTHRGIRAHHIDKIEQFGESLSGGVPYVTGSGLGHAAFGYV